MNTQVSLTLWLFTAALAAVPWPAHAQPTVDARLAVALDALDPSAFESESRGTFQGSFAPSASFASQRGRVYYELDGGSFNAPGNWTFLAHALGASYRVDLADDEKAHLFVGGSGSWRRNGEAWSETDYDALVAFANLELRPRSGVTLRTGYRLAERSFAQIPDLGQFEQDAFVSLNVNLQSRTTLIAESHFGFKAYQGETFYEALSSATPQSSSVSSGYGRSRAGTGPSVRPTMPMFLPTGTSGEHARQWNALLRVAQGLGERTGAWTMGFVRRTSGRVPPAIVATPAGFFDDGVYDDPFASNLSAVSGGLKHVFTRGAALQAWGSWQAKDFTGVVALDAVGLPQADDPLREDRITRGGINLSLPMPAPGAFALALALDYGFTLSRSNDAFSDYRTHAVGLALTISR